MSLMYDHLTGEFIYWYTATIIYKPLLQLLQQVFDQHQERLHSTGIAVVYAMTDEGQRASSNSGLLFVVYKNAISSQDPTVRDTIRRHAMRDVANTRRLRQNYSNPNVGQYPVVVSELASRIDEGSVPTTSSALGSPAAAIESRPSTQVVVDAMIRAGQRRSLQPFPMSASEAAIRRNIPFLRLVESLIGLHFEIPHLRSECGSYRGALRASLPPADSRQLLSFIPSRYGRVPSLTHATDCLSARLQQIIQSDSQYTSIGDVVILNYHAMALKALQAAINDPDARMLPETLCAAELLYFFELLNGRPEIHPYKYHGAGVSRLIQLREPENFRTDFERALLMAYTGPLVSQIFSVSHCARRTSWHAFSLTLTEFNEALLDNTACFLMEDRWLKTLNASITQYSFSSPGLADSVLDVWSHIVNLPALFKETTDLVLSSRPSVQVTVQGIINRLVNDLAILDLRLDAIRERRVFHEDGDIRSAASTINPTASGNNDFLRPGQNQPWPVLKANYVMCWLIRARLLSALSPFHFHILESKCQAWSKETVRWRVDSSKLVQWGLLGGLYMFQSVCVANSIIYTKEIWADGWTNTMNKYIANQENRGMIEKWKYKAWCQKIGRKEC